MPIYQARTVDEIVYQPHAWQGVKIGVFRVEDGSEEKVGEYERNYPSLFNTFFHFTKDGKDFALYSPDYTVTRVMELPSCKDIGGEEPDSWGFCPVDYFVPSYVEIEHENTLTGEKSLSRRHQPKPSDLEPKSFTSTTLDERKIKFQTHQRAVMPIRFYPFGFVAGCIWGDDSSWKIQYLDLSEADKGVVKREEKFGYVELPRELNLAQAIDMSGYAYELQGTVYRRIKIAVARNFDMGTSKWIDPEGIE